MNPPTADEIRVWSQVSFETLGYPDGTPDPLETLTARAVEYVEGVTGRPLASMPSEFVNTANEAIQRRVEQLVFQSQEDYVETAADFDLIQSFSVTGYSETRRSPGDALKARMVNPWFLLHDLLWRLMTPDKRDEFWESLGIAAPGFAVTEVDWSANLGRSYDPYPTGMERYGSGFVD